MKRRSLLATGTLAVGAIAMPTRADAYGKEPTDTPQAALDALMAGNQRFSDRRC
jgi:hypothetical protein